MELQERLGAERHSTYRRVESNAIVTATAEIERRYRQVLDEVEREVGEKRYRHIRELCASLARDVAKQTLTSIAQSNELRLLRSNRELLQLALDTTRKKLLPISFAVADKVLASKIVP